MDDLGIFFYGTFRNKIIKILNLPWAPKTVPRASKTPQLWLSQDPAGENGAHLSPFVSCTTGLPGLSRTIGSLDQAARLGSRTIAFRTGGGWSCASAAGDAGRKGGRRPASPLPAPAPTCPPLERWHFYPVLGQRVLLAGSALGTRCLLPPPSCPFFSLWFGNVKPAAVSLPPDPSF